MYKSNKSFLKLFGLSIIIILILISGMNFLVDPGNIYLNKLILDKKSANYPKALFNSKYGILQEKLGERETKIPLSRFSGDFDCVLLGSSRIMQISTIRNSSIKTQCKNSLNLGLSGGTIEDIAIFTHIIINNSKKPKKVFINIDLYTFKYGQDARWSKNKDIYDKFQEEVKNLDENHYETYEEKYIKNLINFEYTLASLNNITKGTLNIFSYFDINNTSTFNNAKKFDLDSGYTLENSAVTLQDGSHVYPNKWQKKITTTNFPQGDGKYKVSGKVYDNRTIEFFNKIVKILQKNDIKVAILLNPFHPKLFKMNLPKTMEHLTVMEDVIQKFALKNNLTLYGSFNPANIGCKGNEFFDLYHPKNTCQDKIDFSQMIK